MKIPTIYILAVTTILPSTPTPVSSLSIQIVQQSQPNSPTKISQCNQLITVANRAVRAAKASTLNGRNSNPTALIRAANLLERHAKELESLSLTDSQLDSYRLRLSRMYRDTSTATLNFVNASNSNDRPRTESAFQAVRQATRGEKQLVNDINRYCSS